MATKTPAKHAFLHFMFTALALNMDLRSLCSQVYRAVPILNWLVVVWRPEPLPPDWTDADYSTSAQSKDKKGQQATRQHGRWPRRAELTVEVVLQPRLSIPANSAIAKFPMSPLIRIFAPTRGGRQEGKRQEGEEPTFSKGRKMAPKGRAYRRGCCRSCINFSQFSVLAVTTLA